MGKLKYDRREMFNGRSPIVAPNLVLVATSTCVSTNLERNAYFQEMTGRTTFKICVLVPLDLALLCKSSHVSQPDYFQAWKELSLVWTTYLWFWVFILLCFTLDRKRNLGLRSETLTFPATVKILSVAVGGNMLKKTRNSLSEIAFVLNTAAATTF